MQNIIKRLSQKDYIVPFLLFCIGILSRFPFLEKVQSHWDGPQYSIGIVRYSLEQQTPAPPGYPLYIALGRFFYELVHDPHFAILLVSLLFSGIGAAAFYLVGKGLFNRTAGFIASLLFLSGPTFYFFGITAYAYGAIPVLAGLLALTVYRIVFKKKHHEIALGLLFSFIVGFRPQESPFLAPLFIYGLYHLRTQERIKSVIAFCAFFFIWIIPFLYVVGGPEKYFQESERFLTGGAVSSVSFNSITRWSMAVIKGQYLSFGIAAVFLSAFFAKHVIPFNKKKAYKAIQKKEVFFFALWIFPSLLFNFFIRSDHAGYQGTYLAAELVLIAYGIWLLTKGSSKVLWGVVSLVLLTNLYIFFSNHDQKNEKPYRQTSFYQSEVNKNDAWLSEKKEYINQNFDPKITILITESYPWRPIMYHLPEYTTYNLEGLFSISEQFRYVVRKSKNWNYEEFQNKTLTFRVPKNTKYLIFTDNNMGERVVGDVSVVHLPKNADITVLHVREGEVYSYATGIFQQGKQLEQVYVLIPVLRIVPSTSMPC